MSSDKESETSPLQLAAQRLAQAQEREAISSQQKALNLLKILSREEDVNEQIQDRHVWQVRLSGTPTSV